MNNFILKEEAYSIIGICMEVDKILDYGFKEIVYKDAIAYEAKLKAIQLEREKLFCIEYKEIILPRTSVADFLFFNEVIVEIKAVQTPISEEHLSQILNYLKVSNCKVGLVINFGDKSLGYKRLIF